MENPAFAIVRNENFPGYQFWSEVFYKYNEESKNYEKVAYKPVKLYHQLKTGKQIIPKHQEEIGSWQPANRILMSYNDKYVFPHDIRRWKYPNKYVAFYENIEEIGDEIADIVIGLL